MKISECMTRGVRMAKPEDTICDVARIMADCDTGALPVNDGNKLIGMITDRDIAVRGVAAGKSPDTQVAEIMTAEVRYCFDDEDVGTVLHNMSDIKVRRLPVLDRNKRLVGIVSIGDLAMHCSPDLAGSALSGISTHGGLHSQGTH